MCTQGGTYSVQDLKFKDQLCTQGETIDFKTWDSRPNLYLLGEVRVGLLCNLRTNLYLLGELGLDFFIVLVKLPESNNRVKTTRIGVQNYKKWGSRLKVL